MMRILILVMCGVCSATHSLMAQSASPSANREALLQRFVTPNPISYRAEVIFEPSNYGSSNAASMSLASRILDVRNGILTSSPAVPSAQFAISDQTKAVSALLNNYQTQWQEIASKSTLANRPIQQLKLLPRDGWRYTRVLWLDEQTGVPLKTEIYRKNELIERIQVKNIDFLDMGTEVSRNPSDVRKADPAPEISTHSMFYVRNVPTGFVLTSVFNDTVHVQQIYSDGLARVSVFVQSLGALPAAGYSQRGSTGFVVRRSGNVDLVAVGDVPQATLERFLSGVDAIQQ